ncbi:alpha/beta hydrolase [Alkalihalobacillus sp. MEB130]|uniref:alpha/beta hydrolase n=1 Tax=Alkalihalobacillus sp. MEB130 TaxID=2976704 RepID=UPI0028DE9951|nr:alpha/beta hydrolase [Alkalihalobacillus sp. MEB130]MDT8860384.1 alpha/beta hydrolase [Alkalihalobacillus sp. MEB130]
MITKKLAKSMGLIALSFALLLSLLPTLSAEASPVRGYEEIRNIAYTDPVPSNTRGNLLDLYLPEKPGKSKMPLIIWSSGSAWTADTGKQGVPVDLINYFTNKGYAVAGVSVRSSSQVQFPGQLHDIRSAIRWLRDNADEYNIDPNRFAISGNSSGGWVAAIAATTSNIWEFEGETGVETSSAVQASVPFFPPTDFLLMDKQQEEQGTFFMFSHDAPNSPESMLIGHPIQTVPELTAKANPLTYIDGNMPAMHVFHGGVDPLLPYGQSEILYEAMAAAGNEVQYTFVPNAGHTVGQIVGASDYTAYRTNPGGQEQILDDYSPTWENIEKFINKSLNKAR